MIPTMIGTLAQANPQALGNLLGWIGAFIAALVVLTVVIVWVRRKAMAEAGATLSDAGIMEQLRRMRDTGQLSAAEYQQAFDRLSVKMRASAGIGASDGQKKETRMPPKPRPPIRDVQPPPIPAAPPPVQKGPRVPGAVKPASGNPGPGPHPSVRPPRQP